MRDNRFGYDVGCSATGDFYMVRVRRQSTVKSVGVSDIPFVPTNGFNRFLFVRAVRQKLSTARARTLLLRIVNIIPVVRTTTEKIRGGRGKFHSCDNKKKKNIFSNVDELRYVEYVLSSHQILSTTGRNCINIIFKTYEILRFSLRCL